MHQQFVFKPPLQTKKDALLRKLWKVEEEVLKPHHRFVHVGVGTEKYIDFSLSVYIYIGAHDLFQDT